MRMPKCQLCCHLVLLISSGLLATVTTAAEEDLTYAPLPSISTSSSPPIPSDPSSPPSLTTPTTTEPDQTYPAPECAYPCNVAATATTLRFLIQSTVITTRKPEFFTLTGDEATTASPATTTPTTIFQTPKIFYPARLENDDPKNHARTAIQSSLNQEHPNERSHSNEHQGNEAKSVPLMREQKPTVAKRQMTNHVTAIPAVPVVPAVPDNHFVLDQNEQNEHQRNEVKSVPLMLEQKSTIAKRQTTNHVTAVPAVPDNHFVLNQNEQNEHQGNEAKSVPLMLEQKPTIAKRQTTNHVTAVPAVPAVPDVPASHFVLNQNEQNEQHVPENEREFRGTTARAKKPTTTPSIVTRHNNRDLRQPRNQSEDVEFLLPSAPSNFLISLNGTCTDIENSQDATNGFVVAFERSLAHFLRLPEDHVHVWEITCGSLIVNFSVIWTAERTPFGELHDRLELFAFPWSGIVYAADVRRGEKFLVVEHGDQALARLEVGPATGHVYQGFIYIIIGAVIGVVLLIVATVFIVRLHRRKGRGFSVSGDCTPTKFSDVNDYTLTRLPRTTKLYLDDVERNPWAYTNPDFHGSLSDVAAPGKKAEYLNFINTGMIPMRDRSPAGGTSERNRKDDLSGGKLTAAMGNAVPKMAPSFTDLSSTKQKMFVDFHSNNQSIFGGGSSRTNSTSVLSAATGASGPDSAAVFGGISTLPVPGIGTPKSARGESGHVGFDSSHI